MKEIAVLLTEDKESVMTAFAAAEDAAHVRQVIDREWDRVLLRYQEQQEDTEYRFYPFHTQKGNPSDESAPFDKTRKGVIRLTNSLIREQIRYTVSDGSSTPVGFYLSFANAKAAADAVRKTGQQCRILDRQGYAMEQRP